jgi:predicted protein tyrosine phosphatase/protein-L-isoaspartate O-methyltransferase
MMNRAYNAGNPFQGNYKKVLCVCSAGLLRSPTTAVVLSQEPYNYNTRAVGLDTSFALIPIDSTLCAWADEIVCMNQSQKTQIEKDFEPECSVISLDIPDSYSYRDPELIELIKTNYGESQAVIKKEELYLDGISLSSGMSVKEVQQICALVKKTQPKTILEIGTRFGRTSINMAKFAPVDCKLICVDIDHQDHEPLKQYPEFKKIQFITADSLKQDFQFAGYKKYDFILIDGNHREKWVENDTKKALKVLNKGGVIVWHDYGKQNYKNIQVKETLDLMGIFPKVMAGTSLAYMEV